MPSTSNADDLVVRIVSSSVVKKLARYCCAECGAKELFLYCWKGCRHVQNLKVFYSETKAICKELETLKETIYAQELRLRDAEALMKEKQQTLDVLMEEVKRLPQLRVGGQDESASVKEASAKELLPVGLPSWSGVAVQLILKQFDMDEDGRLDKKELNLLFKAIHKPNATLDATALVNKTDRQWADSASLLAYYGRAGIGELTDDLHALGIQFGNTPALATSVVQTIDVIHGFTRQAKELEQEVITLKIDVNEKARTTTRLREGFAEVKIALDGKDTEIERVHQHRSHADKELQAARDQMSLLSAELKKMSGDLSARNTAVLDLRALVEDQVHEKEKWQRYCWELEERLYAAVHTSHVKEHDLWKIRDAKKEETRKNMLLYMDRGMGKRHFNGKAGVGPSKELQDEFRPAVLASEGDAETECSCCSEAGAVSETTHPLVETAQF